MKASALGCPSRLPVASFPMMNIMEIDGNERCRQLVSSPSPHDIDVKRSLLMVTSSTYFSSTLGPKEFLLDLVGKKVISVIGLNYNR